MNTPKYSVIVPVYNSAKMLEELTTRIHHTLKGLNSGYEIILVDDGSADDSWNVMCRIKSADPEFLKIIRLTKNFGQHNATFCGLEHASGELLITIDDDLQTPPEEITKLIASYHNTDADLVYGFYQKKHHSFFRNIGSTLLKKSGKFFNDNPGKGSSFRLFIMDLSKKILSHVKNFVFIDELLLWYTDQIDFVQVEHHKRQEGTSGYNAFKLFKLTANLILYYSALPLRIMTYGGLISSALTFILGIYYLIRKFFYNVPAGYSSIIVTILFSTSIIVFSIGIIGEYINRIHMLQNRKPPYSIRKIL